MCANAMLLLICVAVMLLPVSCGRRSASSVGSANALRTYGPDGELVRYEEQDADGRLHGWSIAWRPRAIAMGDGPMSAMQFRHGLRNGVCFRWDAEYLFAVGAYAVDQPREGVFLAVHPTVRQTHDALSFEAQDMAYAVVDVSAGKIDSDPHPASSAAAEAALAARPGWEAAHQAALSLASRLKTSEASKPERAVDALGLTEGERMTVRYQAFPSELGRTLLVEFRPNSSNVLERGTEIAHDLLISEAPVPAPYRTDAAVARRLGTDPSGVQLIAEGSISGGWLLRMYAAPPQSSDIVVVLMTGDTADRE